MGQQGPRDEGGAHTWAYLEVILQPTELLLNQVTTIVEKEVYLSGERDDMGRTQVPATGSKGKSQSSEDSASSILLRSQSVQFPRTLHLTCTTSLH